jgi:EAL domain-containing protein (putative c-di-GMP-specific phosphodiesterase class I)/GGDEF domain-containing protein
VGNEDLRPLESVEVGMLMSLGGGAETVRQLYPGVEIEMYDTMDDSVRALRAGEVDALLHNSYVWSYVLQKPAYSDLKVQPFTVFSMDFQAGAIDDADGRATIERLNRGIAKLDDASRQAVVLDYTSRKLYRYDLSDYMHAYGLVALLVVLLIAAVVVIAVQRVRAIHADQEEKVRMLVDHDPLTGAYSMDGFRKKAEELLRLHPDETHIIGYINFKSFKYINDSLGRKAGDDLLRFYVAKASEFLAEDEAIGRLEADHFAVLTRLGGDERFLSNEENVLDPTRNYFIDRGKETRVQICCGIYVLVPEDYRNIDIDHMLDLARVAEKRVRDTRKDGYEFYNPEQWEKGKRVADVVSHLPLAIKNGELRVWYQPQVNYVTGDVTGAEALCRWEHGKLGWIRPSEFIPVLEETGLIYDLDCFIWEEVCKDLARWNEQGMRQSVSVNLSRCDIRDGGDIAGRFSRLMREHGLTPDQLRVEVTETAFVEDPGLLISTTEKLRELGIVVEMDDFGSGYSSLHMLKEVPVDRIKLDMHFLTSSGDLEKGRVIVSDMIGLVGRLGMEVIAEGVETKGQADFLREHGCSEMQGYYFFKPMPVESFEKLGKTIECA